jgi:hypothetical protein
MTEIGQLHFASSGPTVEISSMSRSFSRSKKPGSAGEGSNATDDRARDILGRVVWAVVFLDFHVLQLQVWSRVKTRLIQSRGVVVTVRK